MIESDLVLFLKSKMSHVTQKRALSVILIKIFIFFIFWINIILRLICESFGRIAVKIHVSFLWGVVNMAYMQQRHLQQVSCRDIHATTCKILLRFFFCTSYVSLIHYKVLILKL